VKKLQNTLYVTTQESYLAREGQALLVRHEQQTRLRIPVHTLDGVVCFGRVSCSPSAMQLCAESGVTISMLTEHGRFCAAIYGPTSGNVLLRRRQYRAADSDGESARIASAMVAAKIANSRVIMQRAMRDRADNPGNDDLARAIGRLEQLLREIPRADTLEVVRGMEGDAARTYFGVFDHLISSQKDDFVFRGRNRRPPLNAVNALLSFVYTMLVHDVRSALESVGLDPAVGFLHRDRPGRPSLALDLMEELRAPLADRLVLSLINLRQVAPGGFTRSESGAVTMDDATRKEVLIAWQKRKQETVRHAFLNETVTVGLLAHVQARLLSRHMRGDLDAYPALFWK
jgi:CRISPR-associated protein Cas1